MRLWIVRFASVDLHPQGLIDIDVTQRQGTFRAMLTFDQRPEFAHPLLRYSTLLAFFAILPCPDQPPSVPLSQLQPCCKLLSTFGCTGTMLHTTPPNPHPSMAVHIFLWESLSVLTNMLCVPLSSGRRVRTSLPSIYIVSVCSSLNLGETTSCTSLHCPSSPVVTKALDLSTEMKVADAAASFSLLFSVSALDFQAKLVAIHQHADHVVTFASMRTQNAWNTTCSLAVSPICSVNGRIGLR